MARGGSSKGPEQQPPRRRQASPTVLVGAAVVAVLVLVAIVLAVVLGGGSSDSDSSGTTAESTPTSTTAAADALPQAEEVSQLFDGVTQHENILGDPAAPVTMVEYADLQCPFCGEFATAALPSLVTRWVKTNKVRVELRPLGTLGPDSARGATALFAAGNQGKFFDLAHLLYLNQGAENSGWLDDALLKRAAASIPGLDAAQFEADRGSANVARQAGQVPVQAQADAVQVTPTILVGKTGGKLEQVPLSSSSDAASVSAAVEKALG